MSKVDKDKVDLGYTSYDVFGIGPDLQVCGGYDETIVWAGGERKESCELTPQQIRKMANIAISRWQALIDRSGECIEMRDPKRFVSRISYTPEQVNGRRDFGKLVTMVMERVVADFTTQDEEHRKLWGLDFDVKECRERGFEFVVRCRPIKKDDVGEEWKPTPNFAKCEE